jgi:sortase (surface protein transpeptidase)
MTAAERGRAIGRVVAAVLIAVGSTMIGLGVRPEGRPRPAAAATTGPTTQTAAASSPSTAGPRRAAALGRATPVHLDIPRIGVHTALIPLGLDPDGTVAVPPLESDAPAGWYRHLASPGEIGSAVILGHVDSARYGPAVFFRLGALRPGDTASVRRDDGSIAVFEVVAVVEQPKTAFPAAAVYGPVDYPALRLITCGGDFDRARGGYRSNTIVYAVLTATDPGNRPR